MRFEGDPVTDDEMHLNVVLGGAQVPSPDPRLDLIVDVVGNAPRDIYLLLAEVRRLRQFHGG